MKISGKEVVWKNYVSKPFIVMLESKCAKNRIPKVLQLKL
jgi:hypothetical protein